MAPREFWASTTLKRDYSAFGKLKGELEDSTILAFRKFFLPIFANGPQKSIIKKHVLGKAQLSNGLLNWQ